MVDILQKIKLPNYTLAQLYSNVLIHDKSNAAKPLHENAATIKHLGNCEKGIVFVVHNTDAATINNDVLDLLVAMLGKLNLSLQQVAIINRANSEFSYQEILKQFNATKIILLGVEVDKISLPIVFPMYKIQAYGGCSYLCSAALDTLKGAEPAVVAEKKQMWSSMKALLA